MTVIKVSEYVSQKLAHNYNESKHPSHPSYFGQKGIVRQKFEKLLCFIFLSVHVLPIYELSDTLDRVNVLCLFLAWPSLFFIDSVKKFSKLTLQLDLN